MNNRLPVQRYTNARLRYASAMQRCWDAHNEMVECLKSCLRKNPALASVDAEWLQQNVDDIVRRHLMDSVSVSTLPQFGRIDDEIESLTEMVKEQYTYKCPSEEDR